MKLKNKSYMKLKPIFGCCNDVQFHSITYSKFMEMSQGEDRLNLHGPLPHLFYNINEDGVSYNR